VTSVSTGPLLSIGGFSRRQEAGAGLTVARA
jgi:hypothetical protein